MELDRALCESADPASQVPVGQAGCLQQMQSLATHRLEDVGEGVLGVGDAASLAADRVWVGRRGLLRDQVAIEIVSAEAVASVPLMHRGDQAQCRIKGGQACVPVAGVGQKQPVWREVPAAVFPHRSGIQRDEQVETRLGQRQRLGVVGVEKPDVNSSARQCAPFEVRQRPIPDRRRSGQPCGRCPHT